MERNAAAECGPETCRTLFAHHRDRIGPQFQFAQTAANCGSRGRSGNPHLIGPGSAGRFSERRRYRIDAWSFRARISSSGSHRQTRFAWLGISGKRMIWKLGILPRWRF